MLGAHDGTPFQRLLHETHRHAVEEKVATSRDDVRVTELVARRSVGVLWSTL